MTNKQGWTTVALSKTTRNSIAALGSKDESFEDVFKKLLSEHDRLQAIYAVQELKEAIEKA